MICSAKQSVATALNGSDLFLRKRSPAQPIQRSSLFLPSLQKPQRLAVSVSKPLHVSSVENLRLRARRDSIKCEAYEAADRSNPVEPEAKSEAAKKLKIGVYFATWWALNVVFNIYNKKVLNAYPFPWLTSTLSLACGSLMMLISWTLRIAEAPKTDFEFWKTLFPVSENFAFVWLAKKWSRKAKNMKLVYCDLVVV